MKKTFTLIFILAIVLSGKSIAQFNTEWTATYQHTTANNFSNESRKVITDAAGNSYVLADVTSNKDPLGNVTTSTYYYVVLSKYSSTGALLVSKNIDVAYHSVSGPNYQSAFGMEIDANDYIYIGYNTYDPTKAYDVNIAKYNTSLVRLWSRRYNPTTTDLGVDLGVSGTGTAYAIVKSVSTSTTYRVIKAYTQVANDTALYSFTATTDVLNAISVKSTSIYATGYRLVSGVKNVMTAKLNDQGTLKWLKTSNCGIIQGDDFGKDITIGADGNLYITGTSDRGAPTENDVLIMKLNTSGTTLWTRFRDYNNSNADGGLMVIAQDVNFVYVASSSATAVVMDQVETAMGVSGGKGVYLPVPVSPYLYLNSVSVNDFKVSINNAFYLTGSVSATDAVGRVFSSNYLVKLVFAPASSRDPFKIDSEMPVEGDFFNSRAGVSIALDYFKNDAIWLTDLFSDYNTHLQETVVLTDLGMISPIRQANTDGANQNAVELSIYPNPSSSTITITSGEKISKIEIFDLTGKNIKSITTSSQILKLDISSLQNGIYIGKIYSLSGLVTSRKIIKNGTPH